MASPIALPQALFHTDEPPNPFLYRQMSTVDRGTSRLCPASRKAGTTCYAHGANVSLMNGLVEIAECDWAIILPILAHRGPAISHEAHHPDPLPE